MLPAIGLRLRRWMWSSRHFACSRNVTPWACFTTCRSAPRCPRHFPRRFHGRGVPFQIWTDDQGRRSGIPWLAYAFSFPALPHPSTNERPTIYHLLRYSRPDQFGAGTARVDTFSCIYVTHAGTGEIGIFPGSDYARIGSVKLLEDVESIGYDPDTKHLCDQRRWRRAPRVCAREWIQEEMRKIRTGTEGRAHPGTMSYLSDCPTGHCYRVARKPNATMPISLI